MSRMAEAWPYRLFVLMGGARANVGLLGDDAAEWIQILRKAQIVLGTDDPTTINTWADNQYKRTMGLETQELPTDQSQLAGTLMGAPSSSLLG